jgi:tight adherence protein B
MLLVFSIGLSSLFFALALWFAWRWYIPFVQRISQRPIASQLIRARELGIDANKLGVFLFVLESFALAVLIWGTFAYAGLILGGTLIAIAYHIRSLALSMILERRERVLRQQTLSFATGLSGLVRGGLGLVPAIDTLIRETPAPLGTEIGKIIRDYHRGRPLIESIDAVRSSLRLDSFSLLTTSITCSQKQGAPLSQSLAGVQEALEHRDQAERQLTAKTSNARRTILILACTPPGFFLLFWWMQPDAMQLVFSTAEGRRMLAAIIALMYVGIAWAKHLATIR